MADFDLAALRHYDDALFLHQDRRLPSADHLAGLAAECALKQILLSFLGGRPNPHNPHGKPHAMIKGKAIKFGHLPDLWAQMQGCAAGRTAVQFVALINSQNPFKDQHHRWDVADRYSDGGTITAGQVVDHLAAARRVIGLSNVHRLLGCCRDRALSCYCSMRSSG